MLVLSEWEWDKTRSMPEDTLMTWKTGMVLNAAKVYEDPRYKIGYKLDTGIPPGLPTKLVISLKMGFKLPLDKKVRVKLYTLDILHQESSVVLIEESFALPEPSQLNFEEEIIWRKDIRKVVGQEILAAETIVAEVGFEGSNATITSSILRFEIPISVLNFLKPFSCKPETY